MSDLYLLFLSKIKSEESQVWEFWNFYTNLQAGTTKGFQRCINFCALAILKCIENYGV